MPKPIRQACSRLTVAVGLALRLAAGAASAAESAPRLVLQAPAELEATARQIESLPAGWWASLARLAGADGFGEPIVVVLAPEGSAEARRAAPWISGYADGRRGIVVLLPSRVGRYPDDGLPALLRHELAHVLVARAAGGEPVPRWFDEGLAMAAARPWALGDRARVALAVLGDDRLPIARLDAAFAGGEIQQQSAYALAGDLVRSLLQLSGADTGVAILRRLAAGERFEAAFVAVTGIGLASFERDYWERRTLWDRWIPVVSSSVVLWAVAALLVVAAYRRRRQRDAELARKWREEEAIEGGDGPGDG